MSVRPEKKDENAVKRLVKAYLRLLKERPVLTKSLTSAAIAGSADVLAQRIVSGRDAPLVWRTIIAFAAIGGCYTGPLSHYFYRWLEKTIPANIPYAKVYRVILDRFVFAPPYLLGIYYILSILEGKGHSGAVERIRETFWTTLKMNWKIWTAFQYVNINFVPVQLRVLFASMVAFWWTVYIAVQRRS
ncbi:LOW QUALITY PROTEIN: peroxisomal membrane protein 2-like [Amphiura filiformis]|uniref:LOW QUALITY PROTEIN: peroxisomal membrane protein 2-like n=1 Tax=Amphiura filiformis TaxID=82378 RepID=UPI003B21A7A4